MLDILLLILFTLAFLGLVGLVLRKLPILKVIDVEQVANIKQQQIKHDLVALRLKRQLIKWWQQRQPWFKLTGRWWESFIALIARRLDLLEKTVEEKLANRTAPEKVAAETLVQAESAVARGDLKQAETIYLQFISHHPQRLDAYEGLAGVYLEMRDYEQAREVYEYLAEKDRIQQSTLGLAKVASGQGQLDEAKNRYLNSLTLVNAVQPHLELARIYNQLGNVDEAIRHLNQARQLEPNNPKILDFFIELSIVNGQPIEAQAALDLLREVNPENQKIAELSRCIRELSQKLKPQKTRSIDRVTSFGLTIKGKK